MEPEKKEQRPCKWQQLRKRHTHTPDADADGVGVGVGEFAAITHNKQKLHGSQRDESERGARIEESRV